MNRGRALELITVCVIAVALLGLFIGVQQTHRETSAHKMPVASNATTTLPVKGESRSYRDMRVTPTGENARTARGWIKRLRSEQPDKFAVVVQTEAQRDEVRTWRAQGRAYDGAPPTIPHGIDQLRVPACLVCHEHGVKIGRLAASVMSHTRHDSCLQCHVVRQAPLTLDASAADNTFEGFREPRIGVRAWQGAPPTIPHSTQMRESCMSCHGVWGRLGIRSTHPWRDSCTQCHAPTASLEQRPLGQPPFEAP